MKGGASGAESAPLGFILGPISHVNTRAAVGRFGAGDRQFLVTFGSFMDGNQQNRAGVVTAIEHSTSKSGQYPDDIAPADRKSSDIVWTETPQIELTFENVKRGLKITHKVDASKRFDHALNMDTKQEIMRELQTSRPKGFMIK